MILQQGVDALGEEKALDAAAKSFQGLVKRTYRRAGGAGQRVANALYGTWLGHPFHPAVNGIPIGAWTAGVIFDTLDSLSERRAFARCADAATAIGTVAGVGAILSGLTDWQHVSDQPRRIGLVHAIANISITLVQGASLLLRVAGLRQAARLASGLSYGVLIASAYLGGEMVGKHLIGTNRAAREQVPGGFVPVMAVGDLKENELRQVQVKGSPVLLVRQAGRVYAMHATCTHLGGPLPLGALVDGIVQCPWHASRFALDDGSVVAGPATFPERCLATRVRDGQIEVGPGAGLGRCRHEAVQVTEPEAMQPAPAPA